MHLSRSLHLYYQHEYTKYILVGFACTEKMLGVLQYWEYVLLLQVRKTESSFRVPVINVWKKSPHTVYFGMMGNRIKDNIFFKYTHVLTTSNVLIVCRLSPKLIHFVKMSDRNRVCQYLYKTSVSQLTSYR